VLILDTFIVILSISGLLALTALLANSSRVKGWLSRKEAIKLGKRNLKLLEQQNVLSCTICDKPVAPMFDVYDKGRWWHKQCWEETTK
jgi:hypothetical protein